MHPATFPAKRCRQIILLLTVLMAGGAIGSAAAMKPARIGTETVLGPRTVPAVHAENLTAAWDAYARNHLAEAESWFKRILDDPASTPEVRAEAMLGTGWTYAYRQPIPRLEAAEQLFARIVTDYPDSSLAAWALIEIGTLKVDKSRPNQEPGRAYYRRVLADYPDTVAVHEAALRLANSLLYELADAEMEEGAKILEDHLRRHPDNPLAVIMHFRLDYYYNDIRQDYAACLPHAIKVAEMKFSDPFRWSRQYWHVAEILRLRLGRADEAMRWYRRIVEECPTSEHAYMAGRILREFETGPDRPNK